MSTRSACHSSPGLLRLILVDEGKFVFFLLFCIYGYFHQGPRNGTAMSRLDLLHSVVFDQTVAIDRYHSNTPDKAFWEGRYYSDKAPGTVVLALPGFGVGSLICLLFDLDHNIENKWLVTSWFATALSAGLIGALGGAAMYAWLRTWVSRRSAFVTTIGLFLGAAPFPYATALFSHTIVVGLVSLVLAHFGKALDNESNYPFTSLLLAGAICGFAIASEYSSGIAVIGLMILVVRNNKNAINWFAAGAVVPLAMIPLYSWICFKDPFCIGYSHEAVFHQMKDGLYGITTPDFARAYNLLFSPARGLLFWSPIFVMAFFGFSRLHYGFQGMFWFCYMIPFLQIVIISGYYDWLAGNTLGPRYLSPMLPFLALPCAMGIEKLPRIGLMLSLVSIIITGFATVLDGLPAMKSRNPFIEEHIPRLANGAYVHNLGNLLGLTGHLSLVPIVVLATIFITIIVSRQAQAKL